MPAYAPDIVAALDLVVTRLHGVGVEASVDPALVNAPGVWVKWTGLDLSVVTLGGPQHVTADLVAVVPANAMPQAIAALQELAEEVIEEFGYPDAPVRTQATLLPESTVALPSLVLPYLIEA